MLLDKGHGDENLQKSVCFCSTAFFIMWFIWNITKRRVSIHMGDIHMNPRFLRKIVLAYKIGGRMYENN